jgi:outer membrane immunogenic protein
MVVLRKQFFGLAVLAGLAFPATGALAGGTPRGEAGYVDRPGIWQGLYGGVHLGHADADFDDGLVGGVQLGYNWKNGLIVYGLEADISASNADTIDWLGSVRGRVGYLIQPGLLLYGTAGLGVVSSDNTDSGFVFGVGVEGKLSETMTARLEYLNYNIDSGHGHGDDDISVIRAGVNFKLGVPR